MFSVCYASGELCISHTGCSAAQGEGGAHTSVPFQFSSGPFLMPGVSLPGLVVHHLCCTGESVKCAFLASMSDRTVPSLELASFE